MPVLKLFLPKARQRAVIGPLGDAVKPIAAYDAFVVLEADAPVAQRLAREHPTEDITGQYQLPLGGAPTDPLEAPRRRGARAAAAQPALDEGLHHHLVQFVGPVKSAWLTALKKAGATLRHPTAGFGQVVCADGAAMARIQALPFVRWCGHLPHADRVAASALDPGVAAGQRRRRSVADALTVDLFEAAHLGRVAQAAEGLGFSVLAREKGARRLHVQHEGTLAQRRARVQALSAVHGVRWIGARVLARTNNTVAAGLIGQAAVTKAPFGLSGEGEIVAVCDTGLDTGDAADIHPDFAGRVLAIRSYPVAPGWAAYVDNPAGNDGAADVDSGHGTHVAGSVLGSGAGSAQEPLRIQGMAPRARLVFQAVEQLMRWKPGRKPKGFGRYELTGIPDDLGPLLRWAYERGARVHSNSWGGGDPGAYDAQCEQVDAFVWRHKDFCVVVAAGNDGSDADGDGTVNPGSVTSPATAKNCITVGASENLRPAFNAERYGDWWPTDFPAAPLAGDPMANNARQLAAFSSRGPTTDGRLKPEVVAPGTFILSTRSTQIAANNFAWAAYPANRLYFHMGGTSMATPLVAGCLALIREHLRKAHQLARPSAALLKAVLIAGAQRLPGGGAVLADNDQGFGRVDLERSLRRLRLATDATGLRTGQQREHVLQVSGSSRTLRVALAYCDWPGKGLINNLNLIVTAPSGRRYVGNQRAGSGLLALDSHNNTELVQVANAAAGTWRIEVVASNVTQGPQDYALAAVLV